MDMSKECPKNDGRKRCWTRYQTGEEKGETQKSMEREYTARNGMEEFTTWGLGEQERMASRMREMATAVKKPLIYIYIWNI